MQTKRSLPTLLLHAPPSPTQTFVSLNMSSDKKTKIESSYSFGREEVRSPVVLQYCAAATHVSGAFCVIQAEDCFMTSRNTHWVLQ
jgi:hypothetical protein